MKYINITNDEILEELSERLEPFHPDAEIINELTSGKMTVDNNGDILAITADGKQYWITTEPRISRFNKCGRYVIDICYQVHEGSKYNPVTREFIR